MALLSKLSVPSSVGKLNSQLIKRKRPLSSVGLGDNESKKICKVALNTQE
jgi:hypothetical protein